MAAVFLEDPRLNDVIYEMSRLPHPTAEDRLRLAMGRQLRARLFDGLYEMEKIATRRRLNRSSRSS